MLLSWMEICPDVENFTNMHLLLANVKRIESDSENEYKIGVPRIWQILVAFQLFSGKKSLNLSAKPCIWW